MTPGNEPIFLFGCPRSGTSLLSRMLGAHPRIAIPFESHFYNTFHPWLRHYGDLGISDNRERLIRDILATEVVRDWFPRPVFEHALAEVDRYDFHGIVEAIMNSWTSDVGKERWGEKTPDHVFAWRTILEGFPDLQVIHMVRDVRDVALSWKRARFGPKHVYLLANRWVTYLQTVDEIRKELPPEQFFELRYEDLLESPEDVLRDTCRFLREEYSSGMLQYHRTDREYRTDKSNLENLRRPVMRNNAGKWVREMEPGQLRVVEAVAGPTMERFGYERRLDSPSVTPFERFRFRYLVHPPRKALAMIRNRKGHVDGLRRLGIYLRLRLRPPKR